MFSTNMCSICLEDSIPTSDSTLSPDITSILTCNHSFHTECLAQYFIYKYNQNYKENVYFDYNNYHYYHNYKCPMCRKHIRCKDIHQIIYKFYLYTKNEYELYKKEFNKLKKEYCIINLKYKIKKIFIKNTDDKIYQDYINKIFDSNKIMLCKEARYNAANGLYNSIHYCSCLE
jgi:hypothetical protein